MHQKHFRPANPKDPQKQGWDLMLKGYETKRRAHLTRTTQKHISTGIGHHMARMMKGHI